MSQDPYISVVATSRNDDHGGNMLRRMQIFVNAWIEQCRRHGLASELILRARGIATPTLADLLLGAETESRA